MVLARFLIHVGFVASFGSRAARFLIGWRSCRTSSSCSKNQFAVLKVTAGRPQGPRQWRRPLLRCCGSCSSASSCSTSHAGAPRSMLGYGRRCRQPRATSWLRPPLQATSCSELATATAAGSLVQWAGYGRRCRQPRAPQQARAVGCLQPPLQATLCRWLATAAAAGSLVQWAGYGRCCIGFMYIHTFIIPPSP